MSIRKCKTKISDEHKHCVMHLGGKPKGQTFEWGLPDPLLELHIHSNQSSSHYDAKGLLT